MIRREGGREEGGRRVNDKEGSRGKRGRYVNASS